MRSRLLCALAIGASMACGSLPGDVLGTYQVTMTLVENTCGPGATNLQDGRRYAVEVRSDAKRAYWHPGGQKSIPGQITPDGYRFGFTSIVAASTLDAGAGVPICRLIQSEELRVHLIVPDADGGLEEAGIAIPGKDAGVTPAALRGQHTLVISAEPGADCRIALASQGGVFAALPCTVRYALMGAERKAF